MTAAGQIKDVKLIRYTQGRLDEPDDPSFPFELEVDLRPPDLMRVAFVALFGGSNELVVRAQKCAAIDQLVADNDLRRHPRLRWMTITGPGNLREEVRP